MTVLSSVPACWQFERQIAAAGPEMPRLMVKSFAEALMSAEADVACGAGAICLTVGIEMPLRDAAQAHRRMLAPGGRGKLMLIP